MTMVDGARGADAFAPDRRPSTDGREGPDPLARLIVARWKDIGDELSLQRRDFWQNLAFHFGEQWVWWSERRRQLMPIAQAWSPLGEGKTRLVRNRIRSGMSSLLARLLKSQLEFDVPPTSSSDDVVSGAMLAEDVLMGTYHDQQWASIRFDEVFAAFMGGTSAVAVEWDGSAGVELERDPMTGAIVGTGECRLTALNITEFGLEPGVRSVSDARWWVQAIAMAPKVAQAKYGLAEPPKADAAMLLSPLQTSLMEKMGRPRSGDMTLVLCLYERPNKEVPAGRYVCVVGDKVVAQSKWPFTVKDRLNLQLFREDQIQGTWIGSTMLNDAVRVQTHYNFIRSNIAEHAKKVGNAKILNPQGATNEDDWTDNIGDIIDYQPDINGGKPEYMAPPQLPRWLIQEAADAKAELDDIMHVHDTSRGSASFDRASGQALALLAEKDDSPLGLLATDQMLGWSAIGSFVLEEYAARVTETRTLQVPPRQTGGAGMDQLVQGFRQNEWNGKRLRGQTRAYVPLDSVMPYSQAARQQFANDLWDRKINTDPVMHARLLGLPARDLLSMVNPDVARAQRENTRMMVGEVEFPEDFDEHDTHIAEHNRLRKSDAYRYAPAEIRSIIDDHIKMHEQMTAAELAKQMQRSTMNPALAGMAQAHEPKGSQVPLDYAQQIAGQGQDPNAAAGAIGGGPQPGQPDQGPPQTPGGGDAGSVAIAGGAG
jgi:hypothetical protein